MAAMLRFKLIIILFSSMIFWASAFVGIRASLKEFSPEGLAAFRYLIASIGMWLAYQFIPNRQYIEVKHKLLLILTGVIGIGIYNITLNYGEITVPSAEASFIVSQSPIIVVLLTAFFLKERITAMQCLGFFVSFCGVVLIAFGHDAIFHWQQGMIWILLTTLTSAIYNMMQKFLLKYYSPLQVTAWIIWGGELFLLLFSSSMIHDISKASWYADSIVIYLGIAPAMLAYWGWCYVVSYLTAIRAMGLLFLLPILTMFIAWIWLAEIPTALSIIGGACALFGVWIINSYAAKHSVAHAK